MGYVEGLARGLKDEDPAVRVRVANALEKLEDPHATMHLILALDDECLEVRRAVAWALHSVADERAVDALVSMLSDSDDSIRFWAASGLVRLGDERSVDALIRALGDTYEGVRQHAIIALARIGDRKAIDSLRGVLEDEDLMVRRTALTSLRETFGVQIGSDFEGAMKQMRDHSREQKDLNEKLETALQVISKIEQASGIIRDEELYRILSLEHGIGDDEAVGLILQLLKKGLIHWPKRGYTQICI